ncbi:MAG: ATP synthase F0 subunit B [Chloroflexi bacterium]|nr:ATP synthase F0 subunit B [Chloroflexota bacterium]
MDQLGQLGINLGYLLVQITNFAIIFFVLRIWVYVPLVKVLEDRRERIAKGLEDARIAAEARENAEAEAEKIMTEARSKAAAEAREVTVRAEAQAKDIRAAAEAEAGKAREKALADVEAERNRLLGDVRGQVAGLAVAAAQKLIGEALDTNRQRALIDEFFSGVKAGKVTVLPDAGKLTGDGAVVTSALPLTKSEEEAVQNDILKTLGGKGKVDFKVDPRILGGLVVRVGDKVLDGSVSGQLNELRQNLR